MAGTHGVTETAGTEISQLVAGETHEMKIVTVTSGQKLKRGAVMESASQKYMAIATPTGTPLVSKAEAILAEDVCAAAADKQGQAYLLGKFRYSDLVWPNMTAAHKKLILETLQSKGILVDVDLTTVEK